MPADELDPLERRLYDKIVLIVILKSNGLFVGFANVVRHVIPNLIDVLDEMDEPRRVLL